ncbi:MAG TPA: restriction endonuclease subunit R, partial [Thermoanaerobaculia bacterium]|nr:restriction endonuclease subunit R [Thermoanaerobaculia bacterium]
MSLESFVVRPKRRLVEKYREPVAWTELSNVDRQELAAEVAGLPSGLASEEEEAKWFDLLMLHLQLSVLRHEPSFQRLSEQVRAICGLLEEKAAIPMVRERIVLIQAMQSDEWWQDV